MKERGEGRGEGERKGPLPGRTERALAKEEENLRNRRWGTVDNPLPDGLNLTRGETGNRGARTPQRHPACPGGDRATGDNLLIQIALRRAPRRDARHLRVFEAS